MAQSLAFNFNINDPNSKSTTTVVVDSATNYVSHSFLQIPIYDTFGVQIGYKVSDDYIQQLAANLYSVRINSTYFITGQGTISWQYSFTNTQKNYFYPTGVLASSNITATTGNYLGKTGAVALLPNADGSRNVVIGFNYN